jgi:hypothetical protein
MRTLSDEESALRFQRHLMDFSKECFHRTTNRVKIKGKSSENNETDTKSSLKFSKYSFHVNVVLVSRYPKLSKEWTMVVYEEERYG